MSNWWGDKNNFNNWLGKLKYKPDYKEQGKEVINDLKSLCTSDSFLDVGGGDGRIGLGTSIDISNGFDITKNWEKQGLTSTFEVVFTSLVLVTLPENEVDIVLTSMAKHSQRFIYLFEEIGRGPGSCGVQISPDNDYGGKYAHDWETHVRRLFPNAMIYFWDSTTKPQNWVRIVIDLKPRKRADGLLTRTA